MGRLLCTTYGSPMPPILPPLSFLFCELTGTPPTKLFWVWEGPPLFCYCLVERVRVAALAFRFIWPARGVTWCKSPKLRFFCIQMLPFCLISENSLFSAFTAFGFVPLLGWNRPPLAPILLLAPAGFYEGNKLCTELLRLPSPADV